MDSGGVTTDPEYDRARTDAEKRFYIESVRWEQALLKQAEQLPSTPKADAKKLLKNVASAAWKGAHVPVTAKPSVSRDLILGLTTLCSDYVKSDLDAFTALLGRRQIPTALAVSELEKHATSILEEAHRRKWQGRVKEITSFFPGSSWLEEAWIFVTEETEEHVRNLESLMWLGLSSHVAPDQQGPESAPRVAIENFMLAVLAKGRKIRRKDIWLVAGYTERTEFERFQRNDEDTTKAAKRNFARVLNMSPKAFIEALDELRK